jgi:hypothetical protein
VRAGGRKERGTALPLAPLPLRPAAHSLLTGQSGEQGRKGQGRSGLYLDAGKPIRDVLPPEPKDGVRVTVHPVKGDKAWQALASRPIVAPPEGVPRVATFTFAEEGVTTEGVWSVNLGASARTRH